MLLHDERVIASQNKVVMSLLLTLNTLSNFARSLLSVGINLGVASGSQCQEPTLASSSCELASRSPREGVFFPNAFSKSSVVIQMVPIWGYQYFGVCGMLRSKGTRESNALQPKSFNADIRA